MVFLFCDNNNNNNDNISINNSNNLTATATTCPIQMLSRHTTCCTLALLLFWFGQVGGGEVGALQGTTDTAKTVCSVLCGPAMAWIFGYFISENAYPRQVGQGARARPSFEREAQRRCRGIERVVVV